jgi:Ca-activated chloride channel family protein
LSVLEFSSIQFVWPLMLWALLLWPLMAAAYLWLTRPGRWPRLHLHVHGPNNAVAAPATATATATRWRLLRWPSIPVCLWGLGLAAALLALARPQAVLLLPSRLDSVMLAIDTSGSMRATDVPPNRLEAALAAVRIFIEEQPVQVKVGIVNLSGTASVAQAPTTQRDELFRAIENLPLQRGSALGSGIVVALANLLPGSGIDPEKIIMESDGPPKPDTGRALVAPGDASNQVKLTPGANKSMAIVLITDGQSNIGPDVLKMAQLAADHGVRVYTVGVGTPEGVVLRAQGMSMRVRLDETVLKKVAEITEGNYYRASDAQQLLEVYRQLGTTIRLEKHQLTEVTAVMLALAMLLVLCGSLINLRRHARVL